MAKGRTTICIVCYYFKIAFIAVVCSSKLSRLDYGDILNASHKSCIAIIPEALAEVGGKAHSVLLSVADSFKNEPKVVFHIVDFSYYATRFQDHMSKIDYENSFVVFKLLRKDRMCLLTPKSNNIPKPDVYSFQSVTDYDLSKIIDFINDKCLAFRKINGNLTPQGIHEDYILNNLFSFSNSKETTDINASTGTETERESESTNTGSKSEQYGLGTDSFCAASAGGMEENDCETTPNDSSVRYESMKYQPKVIHQCERISLPLSTSEFLNEYLTKSKPVVITGATSHWSVFEKWKNQYLREKYGDIKVHIKITPNGEYEGVELTSMWENKSKVKIPQDVLKQLPFPDLVVVRPATMEIQFSDFIHLIESIASSKSSNISAYLEYSSISYFPDLEKDINEMSFIDGILDLKHTNVWLSDGNTVGKLHFDPFDNFMCQISGEKEFILYDPHENERLYEAHIQEAILSYNTSTKKFSRQKLMESTSMVMSPVDIEKPDLKRFPQFSKAEPVSCKIQPGDVLFTPAFWWHEVRSKPSSTEHRNLAVNFWYDPFFLKEFPCPECRLYINPKYFNLL